MKQIAPTQPFLVAEERSSNLFDSAEVYHEASKNRRYVSTLYDGSDDDRLLAMARSERGIWVDAVYRHVAGVARTTGNAHKTPLPLTFQQCAADVTELILNRRSDRVFAAAPVTRSELGSLLRLSYGFSRGYLNGDPSFRRRASPSSGGLYSLELYVAVDCVEEVPSGLYHYDALTHELALLDPSVGAGSIAALNLEGSAVREAAVGVIFTAVIERLRWKYGARSYRLALLDVGHTAQQMSLVGMAHGLTSCSVQAFVDDELAAILGVDGVSEIPLHALFIGRPRVETAAVAKGASQSRREGTRSNGSPRLRNMSDSPFDAHDGAWMALDARMRAAGAALAAGATSEARAELIALQALLPTDETVREYVDLADADTAPLSASEAALLAFPDDWPDTTRQRFATLVDDAAEVVRAWLGVNRFPATFVDLRHRGGVAKTHIRNRAVQRKITLPESATREDIVHELVHSFLAPGNLIIAEGLACLVATTPAELRQVEAELAQHEHPPIALAQFFGPTSVDELPITGTKGSSLLLYPVAASFVHHLLSGFGREPFFAFTDAILLPIRDAKLDQTVLFERVFGQPLRDVVATWWSSILAGAATADD